MHDDARHLARLVDSLEHLDRMLALWEAREAHSPFPQPQLLSGLLPRLQELARSGADTCEGPATGMAPESRIIGRSPVMLRIHATLRRISSRASNVLVEGESGTGKELVARTIHTAGPRRHCQFVPVDCGCLSDSLLESELFGHRRGSFTGATMDRVGLIEEADGGTLFLDEIANASPAVQTRLLRVLQEGEFRRVGENRLRRVDLRVIAATSGNLRRLVRQGRFREDLFYRLNVMSLDLPPLRRRTGDIPDLVEMFLDKSCRQHGLGAKTFTTAALEILERYSWPGNVRELSNVVERSVLLAPGRVIEPASLPGELLDALLDPVDGDGRHAGEKNGEQQMIERALLESGGDRSAAARRIGWHRTKLYRRLRQYAIPSTFGRDQPHRHHDRWSRSPKARRMA